MNALELYLRPGWFFEAAESEAGLMLKRNLRWRSS